jgi:membrane protein
VLLVLAVVLVAVLYYATPNVKQPKFRWMSIGAFVALLTLVIASALFAFYVANFSSYNETYGSIGGIIVFLLWVWIANIALLFGAELDAEIERGRELQAGIAAEENIQLPPRDTKKSDKTARKHKEDVERGRALRAQADPEAFAAEQEKAEQAEAAEPVTEEERAEGEKALKKARRSQSRSLRRVQNRLLKK